MEKTKVVLAQPSSGSLRTTIPAAFARTLGITVGSELAWDLQTKDSQFVLIVRVLFDENAQKIEPESRRARKKGGRA